MSRFLITGFSGFVSRHFIDYLENNGINSDIMGIDLNPPSAINKTYKHVKCEFIKQDLLDKDNIQYYIHSFQPDYILHLASYSSVAFSWQNPIISYQNNINIFLNLLEAVRLLKLNCRILSVGSSEEYGNINRDILPLKEEYDVDPISPYAVARASQEMLSKVYVKGFDLNIVLTRSFNHIGRGQKDSFVIPSFARQLTDIKKGLKKEMLTGDISIVRDFIDVRDVVAAYYTLFMKGSRGEIYNVCSGVGYSLKQLIEMMEEILGIKAVIKVNPDLIRPDDNRIIIGSNDKLRKELGWSAQYSIRETLMDVLDERLN